MKKLKINEKKNGQYKGNKKIKFDKFEYSN